jgi:hypothetical protein
VREQHREPSGEVNATTPIIEPKSCGPPVHNIVGHDGPVEREQGAETVPVFPMHVDGKGSQADMLLEGTIARDRVVEVTSDWRTGRRTVRMSLYLTPLTPF